MKLLKEVTSLQEIIETVGKINRNVSEVVSSIHFSFWFRGHSKNTYNLQPQIFRNKKFEDNEPHMLVEFLMEANTINKNFPEKNCDRLFMLQHYGLPTRLLDWTENLLVAVYFAVSSNLDNDGVLVIINPWNVFDGQKYGPQRINPNFSPEKKDEENYEVFSCFMQAFLGKDKFPTIPGRAYPIKFFRNDLRHFVQKSCFTIHADSTVLDNNHGLFAITIKSSSKKQILKELKTLGIDSFSLFPDLDNLSKTIIEKYM